MILNILRSFTCVLVGHDLYLSDRQYIPEWHSSHLDQEYFDLLHECAVCKRCKKYIRINDDEK